MELQLEECKKCKGEGVVDDQPNLPTTCPRCKGMKRVYVAGFPVVAKND